MNSARSAHLDLRSPKPTHSFREPADITTATGNDTFLMELVATVAFQRLKEIRFLGAIDYCLVRSPNGKPGATRYTRYEHSLGVMQLARLYCAIQGINSANRRLVCAAALLHDIGHPPLSHSMEPVFKEELGIEHHKATKDIIAGRVPLGKGVCFVLRRYGIVADDVIALISGEHTGFDSFFCGPINFDTIEGILRSCEYMKGKSTTPKPETVLEAATRRETPKDRDIVDEFWKYKDWVYKHIINSRRGIFSDLACQLVLRSNLDHVDMDCYFGTESDLFKRLPSLRKLLASESLESEVLSLSDKPIQYGNRNYYVDLTGDFFARRDNVRYRHSRSVCVLPVKDEPAPTASKSVHDPQEALFDDLGATRREL